MPRGQAVKAAHQCDAAALLNLINFCDCFHSVDLKCVREVKIPRIPHWLELCSNKCFVCTGWKMDALPVIQPHPWIVVLAGDPVQEWTHALAGAQCQWRLDASVWEQSEKDCAGLEPSRGCGGATDRGGELCSAQLVWKLKKISILTTSELPLKREVRQLCSVRLFVWLQRCLPAFAALVSLFILPSSIHPDAVC